MTRLPTRTATAVRTPRRGAFLRYLLVGGFNSLLDLGLFTLFAVIAGLHPLVANLLSTVLTLCVSFLLNRAFVFRTQASVQGTVFQFAAITLISGLVVQAVVIWFVIKVGTELVSGSPDLLAPFAKICAMGVGLVFNFLGYRWLFGSERASQGPPASTSDQSAPDGPPTPTR